MNVQKLFGAEWVNVQPHSGAQANMAVFMACLQAGDKFMGMDLSHGGHLSHGSPVNFSGLMFQPISYTVDQETGRVNYEEMEEKGPRRKAEAHHRRRERIQPRMGLCPLPQGCR